jgi:hypothetical protein
MSVGEFMNVMSAPIRVNLLISIDDDYSLPKVAQKLQSAGLTIEEMMAQLGIITGSCELAKLEALSDVKGVSYIEAERSYQLAPSNWAVG